MANSGRAATLIVGQALETDRRSRANISISSTGEIQVDPDSKVRLVASTSVRKWLALDRGTIHAMIWAPPGRFVVDTPSAVAVDLGCAYTLHVDDSGAGLLATTFGWVGFKLDGRESFVPAGAVCMIRPHIGPGTPYFEDASQMLREALTKLDFDPGKLPALPSGWVRDYFFYADGFEKDLDFYAAHAFTVEPLPRHTLLPYPYPEGKEYPADAEHLRYQLEFNTRSRSAQMPPILRYQYATQR